MLTTVAGVALRNQHIISEKWVALSILTLCIPLQVISYLLYKTHFNSDPNLPQPLWIPKVYGVGLSINPNSLIGKLVWLAIFIFLVALWGYALFFL